VISPRCPEEVTSGKYRGYLCGRPEDHNGQHRSAQSLAQQHAWTRLRRERRPEYDRLVMRRVRARKRNLDNFDALAASAERLDTRP